MALSAPRKSESILPGIPKSECNINSRTSPARNRRKETWQESPASRPHKWPFRKQPRPPRMRLNKRGVGLVMIVRVFLLCRTLFCLRAGAKDRKAALVLATTFREKAAQGNAARYHRKEEPYGAALPETRAGKTASEIALVNHANWQKEPR